VAGPARGLLSLGRGLAGRLLRVLRRPPARHQAQGRAGTARPAGRPLEGATRLFGALGVAVPEFAKIARLLRAFQQLQGPASRPPKIPRAITVRQPAVPRAVRVPKSQLPFPARVPPASALQPPKALRVPRSQVPFPARVPPPPQARGAQAPPPAANPPAVPAPPANPVAAPVAPPAALPVVAAAVAVAPATPAVAPPAPVPPAPAVAPPAVPAPPVASTPAAPPGLSDAERAQLVKLLGAQGAALFEQRLLAQAAATAGPSPAALPAALPQPAVPLPPAGPLPQPSGPAPPATPTPAAPTPPTLPVAQAPAGPTAPEFFREEYLGLKPDAALRQAQNAALAAGRSVAAASSAGRAVAEHVLEHGTSPETVYKREALRHTSAGLPPERAHALARQAADRAFAARSRAVPAAGGPPATAGLFPGPGAAVPGPGAGPDLAGTLRELLEAVRGLAKQTPAAPGEPPSHRAGEAGPAGRKGKATQLQPPGSAPAEAHDPTADFDTMARKLGHVLEVGKLLLG
jgi:hypothetical protein